MRLIALALLLGAAHPAIAQDPERPARRRPVTPELERSAFADPGARTLLERARAARIAQDSALRAYDAKSFLRMSVGVGIRRLGRERLLLRSELAARVRWARESGVWIEPTGQRTAFPMGQADVDMSAVAPVPYFPGRDALWIPSAKMRVVQAEVDEREMIHPLAAGAEAYYRYETGDSMSISLPDGGRIALRELRITARRPDWRAFVGSFWFDVDRGSLVRAAYRLAADIDLWVQENEENRRTIDELEDRARTDTGAAAREARETIARIRKESGSLGERVGQALLSPMRGRISAITVEYGLYEGRFWLPKSNVAQGELQATFVRLPVRVEESFRYATVNGTDPLPVVPRIATGDAAQDSAAERDSAYQARGSLNIGIGGGRGADTSAAARVARRDSLAARLRVTADSLTSLAAVSRSRGDTARARQLEGEAWWYVSRLRREDRRRVQCATDSTWHAGTNTRFEGALRVAIRLPCDESKLASSPDLPGSIYDPGEEVFGGAERDELLGTLGFALQPAWDPQRPRLRTGLDLVRYNRVEGLSLGAMATSQLGLGWSAQATARLGSGDLVPNAELMLSRSNGRADVRFGVFHRLAVANDDRGAPLSFGASLANVLYARDEGFYHRSWGAEVAGSRDAPGPLAGARLGWRIFGERHRSAGVEPNSEASLAHLFGGTRFVSNIDAAELTSLGAGADLARSFGADPRGTRLDVNARAEGAAIDVRGASSWTGYGRGSLDATMARPLGPFTGALTGAIGSSLGRPPVQRAFFVGGLQTVRGQFARPDGFGRVGEAFWLTRAELGIGLPGARPALFYDAGWAGLREEFSRPGRPLSGAGVGLSLLDGLVRFDVARGIHPERKWRVDLYLDARF